MIIRPEISSDRPAIFALTDAAFAPMPFADGTEAQCINDLRDAGDLTLSLVADEGGAVIGHVAFSPVTIDDVHDGWFGLGPIAVAADRQRQGIGSALAAAGIAVLRKGGAKGVALIGNPAVYGPMGFQTAGFRYRDLTPALVQMMVLDGPAPTSTLRFAPALEASP